MKESRSVCSGLVLIAVFVSLFGTYGVGWAAGQPTHVRGTHPHHQGSWADHDRAVYAVSTLNAPLCGGNQQLSTVLWRTDGARIFDVYRSLNELNLYYIIVRASERRVLGVYAYMFGWKYPRGVRSAKCVDPASPDIVAGFRRTNLVAVGRFHTTFPQS